jgi:conjugal transfer mating pair stabilization protein TraG
MNPVEIFSYGSGDALFGLFNAIAAMMKHSTYTANMSIMLFIGFLAAGFAYALAPHLMIGWKWLFTVMLVFSLLVLPKVTVLINDKFTIAPPRVVDNVPFGLALLGSLTTSVSNSLTDLSETVFQAIPAATGIALPQELSYSQNGMTFGNRVLLQSRNASFVDPNFRTDVINYVRNCTFPDLASGYIKIEDWQKSTNLWAIINDSNPARFTTVRLPDAKLDVVACPDAYRQLNLKMPTNVQDTKSALSYALNVAMDPQNAVTRIDAQLERAYATLRIGNASQGAADLIRQNAMINVVRDAHLVQSRAMNDPAAMMLALSRAQGTAAANMAFRNSAVIQVQSMPVIRSGIEFALYALFPFVVLLLLISHGKTALMLVKSYAFTAIWIQLWPPMFAVVSYLVTISSAKEIEAAARLGVSAGTGLALYTADGIYSSTLSSTSVVSSMFVAVPLMAAAIVWGAERLVSFAASAGASAQRPIDNASSGASTGNVSMGTMSADQLKMAPINSSPYMRESSDIFGKSMTGFGVGQGGVDRFMSNISQLPTSLSFGQGEATKFAESSKNSLALSEKQSERASESRATALSEAMAVQEQFNKSTERSGGSSINNSTGEKDSLKSLMEISQQVNRKLGLDESSTVGKSITASASAGVVIAGSGAKYGVEGKSLSQQKLSEAFDFAKSAATKAGIDNTKEVANTFSSSDAYSWAKRSGATGTSGYDASMRESTEYAKASEKSLTESKEQSKVSEVMRDWSSGLKTDRSNWVAQEMTNRGMMQDYNRASPETQTAMVLKLAQDYARPGGMEIDGVYVPMRGPDPRPGVDLKGEYAQLGVAQGFTSVDNTWNANRNTIVGRQSQAGVSQTNTINDDVGRQVAAASANTQSTINNGRDSVVANNNARVAEYNKGTRYDNVSEHHKNIHGGKNAQDQFTKVYDDNNRPKKQDMQGGPDKPKETPQLNKPPEGMKSWSDMIPTNDPNKK